MINVLHISAAQSWRGGEQQIYYLLRELSRYTVKNYMLCPEGSPLSIKAQALNIGIHCFSPAKTNSFSIPGKINAICIKNEIDIIHIHDSHSHNFAWIAYLRGLKTPSVLSRRVDFEINFLSRWKYNHQKIKHILCVSNAVKKIMQNYIKDSLKLKLIYSGVDISEITTTSESTLRKLYKIDEGTKIIANIASLADHKDPFTFLNTAKHLIDNNKDMNVKFLMIGDDGGLYKSVIEWIEKENLSQDVILTGFIEDVRRYLPEIDVLLVTSKKEGLNTTILDAFNAHVPVVATSAGGIPEIVHHMKTGLLAKVGNALELCKHVLLFLSDENLRRKVITEAFWFVQNFGVTHMALETYNMYIDSIES